MNDPRRNNIRLRNRILIMTGLIIAVWSGCGYFTITKNPEVAFWQACLAEKNSELAALPPGPKILVGGGSSCAFSIHPDELTKATGLPAYNMGGSVLMGLNYVTSVLFSQAKEGDIVILHYEPELFQWTVPRDSPTGIRIAISQGDLGQAFGTEVFGTDIDRGATLAAMRPGGRYLFTYLIKSFSGKPMYRYSMKGWRGGGLIEHLGPERNDERAGVVETTGFLTPEALASLQKIREYADRNGIDLYYVLPWKCIAGDSLAGTRAENTRYLEEISKFVQPIPEPEVGGIDDETQFSDTLYHLNLEAGRKRSALLGARLADVLSR